MRSPDRLGRADYPVRSHERDRPVDSTRIIRLDERVLDEEARNRNTRLSTSLMGIAPSPALIKCGRKVDTSGRSPHAHCPLRRTESLICIHLYQMSLHTSSLMRRSETGGTSDRNARRQPTQLNEIIYYSLARRPWRGDRLFVWWWDTRTAAIKEHDQTMVSLNKPLAVALGKV